ncbi:type II toxin-antitoxin system RelE/ParE family toxin [Dyella koreensis]|uniref:Type II toxin-antitoxin system RelE/ParE family toxin n=1 Tax=Dyella koreensis TaxID=311235 RepID=A0ABW8K2P3_9GAMM
MLELVKSETFGTWMRNLRDRRAKARIQMRIDCLSLGNPGQHRYLACGINEMQIDHAPGYRMYYTMRGKWLAILLCSSGQRSQQADIANAAHIAEALER